MKITINHRLSKFGYPVILDDDGYTMTIPDGLRLLRKKAGINRQELGDLCGVSDRTVEAWEQGWRKPTASALFIAGNLLEYLESLKVDSREAQGGMA